MVLKISAYCLFQADLFLESTFDPEHEGEPEISVEFQEAARNYRPQHRIIHNHCCKIPQILNIAPFDHVGIYVLLMNQEYTKHFHLCKRPDILDLSSLDLCPQLLQVRRPEDGI
jgi:hypothetical protein